MDTPQEGSKRPEIIAVPTTPAKLTKISLNLTAKTVAALDEAVELGRDSKTDTINRAVQVYAFILRHRAEGERLALIDEDNEATLVELL